MAASRIASSSPAAYARRLAPDRHAAVMAREGVARVYTRAARSAESGAKLHQPLIQVAGGGAAAGLDEAPGEDPRELAVRAERTLLGRRADHAQPREHTKHVAIHDRGSDAVTDGGNGAGGVWPDALDLEKALDGGGEMAVVLLHHLLRALVQHPRTPVEAETRPLGVDTLLRRRREVLHGGESFHPREPIRDDGLDACLLTHDLRHPNAIRRHLDGRFRRRWSLSGGRHLLPAVRARSGAIVWRGVATPGQPATVESVPLHYALPDVLDAVKVRMVGQIIVVKEAAQRRV